MREEKKRRLTIKDMVMTGLFAAVTAILAQLAIPTPWGINVTMQTLAVALAGFCLGKWKGILVVFVYMLLGVIGIPVFTNFGAGLGVLAGPTGGYIWGFLFLAFACGFRENVMHKWLAILIGILGLAIFYVCGTIQFAVVVRRTILEALVLTVMPYIWKDAASIAIAYGLAMPIKRVMRVS